MSQSAVQTEIERRSSQSPEERQQEFREESCRRHGWPIDDYEWCLKREQLRNAQKLRLEPRYRRLLAYSDKWRPVRFCPRCGAACSWVDSEALQLQVDLDDFDTDSCLSAPATELGVEPEWRRVKFHNPFYCGECNEHFEVKSVPYRPGDELGTAERRRIMIAWAFAAAIKKQKKPMNEPRSELARYAFGYSDKKPGLTYWLIIAGIVAYIVYVLAAGLP